MFAFRRNICCITAVILSAFALILPKALAEVNLKDRVVYVEDGIFSQELHIPTYEWIPKTTPPKAIVIAIHGLTLHGSIMNLMGRAFAADDYYMIADDMRGFGRCYTDDKGVYGTGPESKREVNYEKSVEDLSHLLKLVKQKYPGIPIVFIGESLGCTIAIHLAAMNPDSVHGLILSAPAVQLNSAMYLSPASITAGLAGIFIHPIKGMSMHNFVAKLVSNDPQVTQEALNDPLIRKHMRISELLQTNHELAQTVKYARQLPPNIPVLILQGGDDKCVTPRAVSHLTASIKSSDQTMRWMSSYGHLLFETSHMRAGTVDAVDWFIAQHEPEHVARMQEIKEGIRQLGGTIRD